MNLRYVIAKAFIVLTVLLSSCGDFFDVKPGDMLLEEDSYANIDEVYSTFLGGNTTRQKAAEQYVGMAEL